MEGMEVPQMTNTPSPSLFLHPHGNPSRAARRPTRDASARVPSTTRLGTTCERVYHRSPFHIETTSDNTGALRREYANRDDTLLKRTRVHDIDHPESIWYI